MSVTRALITMFVGENDLSRKVKEGNVSDYFAQHYFDKLKHKCKVGSIYPECTCH